MKYRKLRIAWSVAWGVVAVLLCVLWVRSTRVADGMSVPVWSTATISVRSIEGRLLVTYHVVGRPHALVVWHSEFSDFQLVEARLADDAWGFGYFTNVVSKSAIVPHWFVILLFATLAALPNIRWSKRFSLRTLLIATTLVAVVLGIIVWMSRAG